MAQLNAFPGWRQLSAAIIALVVSFAAFVPSAATAQTEAEAAASQANIAIEARREALFAAMLNDPTNLDLAFEYAQLSAQVGDVEAAISTLERMLIYAPNLPRLQLELGVLYYRIGAIDIARSYLEAASRENTPQVVQDRVDVFLAQIGRQDQRLVVSGSLHGGIRYQSNATAAPDQDIININGVPIRLQSDARARGDGNIFSLADIHIAYDLQNQNDLIEANIINYNSVFFDISRLNLHLFEAQLGPSFGFGRFGIDGTRLGVYGIAGATTLGSAIYTTQYGGGARLQSQFAPNVLFDSRNEYRAYNYSNSNDYQTVRMQTGGEVSSSNTVTASLSPTFLVQGNVLGRYVYGRDDFNTYGELGGLARATYFFYLPEAAIFAGDSPWAASAALGGFIRRYVGPDPLINAAEAERDNTYWVEAGLSAPFHHGFSTFLTGQLRRQESNYETRDFFNAVVSAGVSKRF